MTENDLINACIDDGEVGVRHSWPKPEDREKLDGSLAGFAFCRGKSESQMKDEVARTTNITMGMIRDRVMENYWYRRYYTIQIEYVLNVLNGARHATNQPHDTCTVSGVMKAAEIIGSGVLEIRRPEHRS